MTESFKLGSMSLSLQPHPRYYFPTSESGKHALLQLAAKHGSDCRLQPFSISWNHFLKIFDDVLIAKLLS